MSDNQNPQLVTSTGLLKFTQTEIDYLQSFLTANDRGGYYLGEVMQILRQTVSKQTKFVR